MLVKLLNLNFLFLVQLRHRFEFHLAVQLETVQLHFQIHSTLFCFCEFLFIPFWFPVKFHEFLFDCQLIVDLDVVYLGLALGGEFVSDGYSFLSNFACEFLPHLFVLLPKAFNLQSVLPLNDLDTLPRSSSLQINFIIIPVFYWLYWLLVLSY